MKAAIALVIANASAVDGDGERHRRWRHAFPSSVLVAKDRVQPATTIDIVQRVEGRHVS